MKKIIYASYIAAAVSAAVLFSLIGMTACTSAKDEPIRLAHCSAYTIVSDTALRSCASEDITQIIEIFDGMEYEKTDIPSRLNEESVGLFACCSDNTICGIGFGSSGDEQYFSYTHYMAVTEFGAGADFFGENSRIYRISDEDYGSLISPLYNLAYHAFSGTVTRVGIDGAYYIVTPDEGEFPQGETFVYSDEKLNFGDKVSVTFCGDVMTTAPLQIRQVDTVKISDGNSPYTGWETVPFGAYRLPDLSLAANLEPGMFRSQCMEEVDFDSETKAGRKFDLVGRQVFADTEKNPEAVYAYYLNIELDCGGYVSSYPALAESVNSGQAPYEIDISRSDNYLNVYDMNGYPLAVFTYGNEMTFYTSMPSQDGTHTGDEIVFFDNPIPEIDEDSAVSMKYSGMGLEVDKRNRTVTDKGSGICYSFDFENRIVSAQ